MKTKITITSTEYKKRAIAVILALPLDPIHEVSIKEYKKDRSAEQNALLWKWYTIIGNALGESKETIHERMKDKYLVNIYERDNEDYAEMVQALREVWKHGMKNEAVALRKRIVALTSTTTATVHQMSEYMNAIEMDAAELAIRLPSKDDL
jgi:hypothetical protein